MTGKMQTYPDISVVVASFTGEAALTRCIDSLLVQGERVELIVATNLGPADVERISHRYSEVHVIGAARDASVFVLRSLGVRQCHCDCVALIEDHCTVSPTWLGALRTAFANGHGIVGGPVANGRREGSYDWALYFCEYGFYMPPQPRGATHALSGINIAYRRQLLDQFADVWRHEFRENEVNDTLRSFGHEPFLEPDAWVEGHLEMSLSYAMRHLYQGGRHFGGYRRRRSTVLRRWMWVGVSPAVSVVLLGRLVWRVMGRDPSKLGALLLAIPYIVCLLAAWSVGEAVGYLRGGHPRGLESAARGDAPEVCGEDRN